MIAKKTSFLSLLMKRSDRNEMFFFLIFFYKLLIKNNILRDIEVKLQIGKFYTAVENI